MEAVFLLVSAFAHIDLGDELWIVACSDAPVLIKSSGVPLSDSVLQTIRTYLIHQPCGPPSLPFALSQLIDLLCLHDNSTPGIIFSI